MTFYPGVWELLCDRRGSREYSLIQSNTVTFPPRENIFSCQVFNLSQSEQFPVPLISVVTKARNERIGCL